MTIFVTGATGFIGRRLCQTLAASGRPVRAMLRPSVDVIRRGAAFRDMGVTPVTVDLTDIRSVEAALDGVETVFHLGWKTQRLSAGAPTAGRGDQDAATNIAGMQNLIGCALKSGLKRFVFTSTIAVYGPETSWSPRPRKEADVAPNLIGHPNPYYRHYGGAKYQSELMLAAAFPPPEFVVLRPSMVYGPGAQFARQVVETARQGNAPTTGADVIQWVHVDDVVRALLLAETADVSRERVFTIAGAKAVSNPTVAAEVRRLLGVKGPMDANGYPIDWRPRVPCYDITAADRVLGFRPEIDWLDGLHQMVEAELSPAG